MASPRQMVKILADATGKPEKEVRLLDRYLGAAQLRHSDGTGPNTTPMQASDVANLIIALLASDKAAAAPINTMRYRRFQSFAVVDQIDAVGQLVRNENEKGNSDWVRHFLLDVFGKNAPQPKHTFGEMIEQLLTLAKQTQFEDVLIVRAACHLRRGFAEILIGRNSESPKDEPWCGRFLYGPPRIVQAISSLPSYDLQGLEETKSLGRFVLLEAGNVLDGAK